MTSRLCKSAVTVGATVALSLTVAAGCGPPTASPKSAPSSAAPNAEEQGELAPAKGPRTGAAGSRERRAETERGAAKPVSSVPCGPGRERLPDGTCPDVRPPPQAEQQGAQETGAVPKPPPHTVPGGLARGKATDADRQLVLADRAYFEGRLDEARKHYEAARRAVPSDPAGRVGLIRVKLAEPDVPRGYAAAPNDAKMRQLLARIDRLLQKHPNYGPAHVERGRVALILGRAQAAKESLSRGLRLTPHDPEAQSALGVALLATGDTEQALDHFRRAADLDPGQPDRLANLGTAYMMLGKVRKATVVYEEAVRLAPDDPRAHSDLGTAYLAANRPKEALPHLERAVKLAPERATFLSNLGYAQQQLGQTAEALSSYEKAIEKDPQLGSAWINLGTVYAAEGQYDKAEGAFEKALALDPTDPRAKANLKELEELREKKK